MKDIKYLSAYLIPLTTIFCLYQTGIWSWTTGVLVFGILPFLDQMTPESTRNISREHEDSRSARLFFDWLLYLNIPLVFGILGYFIYLVGTRDLTWMEISGLTFSVGITVGACGINVAHELRHRNSRSAQILSKILLLTALYQHFFIEHNRGHHKNVATDLDPASARLGETVYAFWLRSITHSWTDAWSQERERLQRLALPEWSWANEMIRFQVYQMLWLVFIFSLFGIKGVLAAAGAALIGVLLLETINYLEHYGLRRRPLDTCHFEPVNPTHSWNSNHEMGRIFLYELTRHSDHHYKSTRKFQVLRHMDESPQLPYGYPASMLLTMVPPLWFRIMHGRMPPFALHTAHS